MAGEAFLGVDIGTSSVKALVVDSGGFPLSLASAPCPVLQPPDLPLAREYRPSLLLRSVARAVAGALKGVRGNRVAGLGVASQRQGFVLLDSRGRELYIGPNLDLRAVFQGARIDEGRAGEVYAVTGHLPSFFFAPARLAWFREHRPPLYRRARVLLPLGAWLAYRLTGQVVAETTLLGEAGLLEVDSGGPARSLLRALGLRDDLLPPLVPPGSAVGHLATGMARAWGLTPGIPVTLAGADTQVALVGMGVTGEGEAGVVAGWSLTCQVLTPSPRRDPGQRTWAGLSPYPGLWVAEANTGDGGQAYRWLVGLLFGGGMNAYGRAERSARAVPPGGEGALAFLGPVPLNLSRVGLAQGGLLFPVPLSAGNLGRGHLVRAGLENLAFAVRGALELLAQVAGGPTTVALGGGMTATALFSEVLASVLGRPLRVSASPATTAYGSALSALAHFRGIPLQEVASLARGMARTVEPDPLASGEYDEYYAQWLDMWRRLGNER